ncbi:outer membrane protein assembly factor BamA [Buchnera aphidicola]|uniref:Outer membrane protein assembly factor BamA n=1 Tax=Buchnera aphidicola subsp. Acyrthosiphon pisum (strain 5A) TaxID=563178 RepID=A0A7U3YA89_BUCA5|nr:outer membrane protein assembly factor BamA [Buchnera aphidicola]ACL30605.1 YaeT [Buchnera aphidicola str. 5A (Acyrthosiphon pisum)]OQX99851.1 MAG: outer membrane protein assembly factor BamA [Erwiniaceae bacterium 4572_131]
MLIKNFFIAFLMFFSILVHAENKFIVKDIQFKGLKNFSQNEALKKIPFRIGSTISQYDVKNSIKSLFKTGKFEDIKVSFLGKTIVFNIRERPIISNVIVSGNHIIASSVLDPYLKKLNIETGKSFNNFFTNVLTKTIKDFYLDIGRCKPDIKILKIFSKNNSVSIKILINEGTEIKINSIKILGVQAFSKEKILSLFKLQDYHSWWNLLSKSTYSPKELNNDLEHLKNFYLSNGYYYFNVNTKKVDFLQDKKQVDITIGVSEGKKYKISNFFVNGNLFPYQKLITNLININPNEFYNRDKIDIIVNKITRFLSEYGYVNTKVIVDPQIDHKKKTIALNFNIDMKKRYFVKRIYFTGNEITQDRVLRRKIKQMEGKYFNIKLVELGKKLLEKTKYFSDVKIIQKLNSYDSNQIDITYQVKEQTTGSINFGLGYGVDSGTSFNLAFSQDNIFGSGNSLKVDIIKNDYQKYLDISTSYPYFFYNNADLNARFFYNDFKYNFDNISNIIKNTYGFEGNLGFLINNYNKVNFGFGYTHNSINNEEKKIHGKLLIKKMLDAVFLRSSLVNDFTINYSWIYDNLEYLYFPTSGKQAYLTGKTTLPGSDDNFYKITLDSSQYIPLNEEKSFIFSNHIYMGIGDSFNKETLPFYENFHTSSENNVRGFHVNTIGPKTDHNILNLKDCMVQKNNKLCRSIDSIGGNLALISNLEMIIPLSFLDNKYSKFLRASVFLDSGNIWDTQSNNTNNINLISFLKDKISNDIYSSFGLSLQWFSPIGPLVFSYAIPIQKNKDYQLEPFQFNIGKHW